MTELEKMERAQLYLKKMTEGINPITDEYADENDTINNVRVSRCLFYVSEILQKVIDNGGEVSKKYYDSRNYNNFYITDEQRAKLFPFPYDASAKDITDRINELTARNGCKKFVIRWITEYLVSLGLLLQMEGVKIITEQGKAFGITEEQRISQRGFEYTATRYTPDAQQFIIDNIDAIVDFAKSEQYKEQTRRNKD